MLEEFPIWHPFKKCLHVELYGMFQHSQDQVHLEPIYDSSNPDRNMSQLMIANALKSFLNCKFTILFLKLFDSCKKYDNSETNDEIYIEN